MSDLYKSFMGFFVFYIQLPNCQQDIIDLVWPSLISSIRQDSCRIIFKNFIPVLILASNRLSIQSSLINYLTILLSEDCIVECIGDVNLGGHLLCLTSSICFLRRYFFK